MRVAVKHVAHIPIHADMMKKVVALKYAVVLHHPEILFTNKGLQYCGGYFRVVVGAKGIADVMQQGADHVLLVTPITQGEGGGLQTVAIAVNRKTTEVTIKQFHVRQHAVRETLGKLFRLRNDAGPILLSALVHASKSGASVHRNTFLSNERCEGIKRRDDT